MSEYFPVFMIYDMKRTFVMCFLLLLRAMEELSKLEEDRRKRRISGYVRKRGIASNEMCTFLILNISSLQLIPVNVIAYRSQYGSVNLAAIVGRGSRQQR